MKDCEALLPEPMTRGRREDNTTVEYLLREHFGGMVSYLGILSAELLGPTS